MRKQRWPWHLLVLVIAASPVLGGGSPETDAPPAGAEPFARMCAACHGATGQGDKAPPIVPLAYGEDQVAVVVRSGQGEMPPIPKAAVSDAELSAIVAYLNQLKP